MSYTVKSTDLSVIRLNESDAVESVLQNIRILLNTWQGEVPLYRDFGIDPEILHRPINEVENLLAADVIEKVETYEPRATVLDVSFAVSAKRPDTLEITVEVEVKNEP